MVGRGVGRGRAKPKEIMLTSGYGSLPPSSATPSPVDSSRDARSVAELERPGNSNMYERVLSENLQKCALEPTQRSAAQRVHPNAPVIARGTKGTPVKVQTNCIKLTYQKGQGINQYDVQIFPEVDDSKRRYKIVALAVTFKKGIRCYNGDKILYLPYDVPDTEREKLVKLDSSVFRVTLTLTAKLEIGQCLPFFGTLIRNCCKALGFSLIGRSFYDLKTGQSIAQHNFKVWSGFITAVDEKEDGVYLTVDSSSRVLRTETAYMVLRRLQENPHTYRNEAVKKLTGITVMTHYNNLMYRVDDINWSGSPATTKFKLLDGSEITIKDYIWKQHKIELLDENQPLFVSKCRQRGPLRDALIYLVPELCQVTGITDEMRQDYQVMKELASYTKLEPRERQKNLQDFIKKLKGNEECRKMLDDWGLNIADDGEIVDARVLPDIDLTFGKGVNVQAAAEWRSTRAPFRTAEISEWVIFYVQKDAKRVNDFLDMLKSCSNSLNVGVASPKVCVLPNDRVATIVPAIENQIAETTQIIVFVMSNQRSDIYTAVKKLCICDKAIASQMILSYTLSKPQRLRAVVSNILLQMVAKLGGALWKVNLRAKETMFCGIDTYHDKGGKHSVAGFVAAIDKDATKYFSQVALQDPHVDLMLATYRSVSSSLNAYVDENGQLPSRIFVFRDGVGQGDYLPVQREIQQLKEACRHYKADFNPQMVFILCVKRINLRYFTTKGRNVDPGTVVDSTVTTRNHPDFMLVSTKSTQGTLTPTHYVVLLNESNLSIDQIQLLTFWFCHLYYNWSGAVRVPAPCLYAHKLAGLIGIVQKHPHAAMDKNLYYL